MKKNYLNIFMLLPFLSLVACSGGGNGNNDNIDKDADITTGQPSNVISKKTLLVGDADCPNGGVEISAGIDDNGNGELNIDEIDSTEFVCHGLDGQLGTPGADGQDGLSSLIKTTDEPSGINCETGGLRIEFGIDLNGVDGLEAGEIDHNLTDYVCNGEMVALDMEAPRLVSAVASSNTSVLVTFSRPMDAASVEQSSHYRITSTQLKPGVAKKATVFVETAELLDPEGFARTVKLTTLSQSEIEYQLEVSNVFDEQGNPLAAPDILINPSVTTFVGVPPTIVDGGDTDGDGLSDRDEQYGWLVTVTKDAGESVTRRVTSNPNVEDTDGDGISDSEEKHGGMDPRSADTDGDALTDNDEWNTIYSDPTDMDSDRDTVQDGFEYYTFRTSPILADTDGDQISDADEVSAGNRNPLIADLPSPSISVGNVNLQLDTRFTFTNEDGELVTEDKTSETTLSRGENDTSSSSNENSTKNTLEFSQELATEFSVGLGSFKGVQINAKVGSKQGSERGSTFTAGQESGRSSEEAFHDSLTTSTARDIRESITRQIKGASIKAFLSIDNVGDVPFTISNLELTAQTQDPGPEQPTPCYTRSVSGS